MPQSCCVVGCKNRKHKGSAIPFYKIPTANTPFKKKRRELWLNAIERDNWSLEKINNASICGAHFISGKRSENPLEPNFVPTIFAHKYGRDKARIRRILCKPANLNDNLSPNWLPNQKLGFITKESNLRQTTVTSVENSAVYIQENVQEGHFNDFEQVLKVPRELDQPLSAVVKQESDQSPPQIEVKQELNDKLPLTVHYNAFNNRFMIQNSDSEIVESNYQQPNNVNLLSKTNEEELHVTDVNTELQIEAPPFKKIEDKCLDFFNLSTDKFLNTPLLCDCVFVCTCQANYSSQNDSESKLNDEGSAAKNSLMASSSGLFRSILKNRWQYGKYTNYRHEKSVEKTIMENKQNEVVIDVPVTETKLKPIGDTSVPHSVRYDCINHWPCLGSVKKRCKSHFCENITKFKCTKCNVYLCVGKQESANCFIAFHTLKFND